MAADIDGDGARHTSSVLADLACSRGLALEAADDGVAVHVVCPDFVETPLLDDGSESPAGAKTFRHVSGGLQPRLSSPAAAARRAIDGIGRGSTVIPVGALAPLMWRVECAAPTVFDLPPGRSCGTERKDGAMSVIKINAITVLADSGDELARRFAARAGAVDGQPGFEGFELLRPTDGRNVWLVLTRWADEESFQGWVSSRSFADGHGGRPADGSGKASAPQEGQQRPVGQSAELWSYEVAGGSAQEFTVRD